MTVKAKEPDKPEVVRVSEVKLNILEYTMETGESVQLTAKINPSNATDKTVTWSSSNTNVATVTDTGLVNGRSEGTATITVKTRDGGKICSCTIMVKKPAPTMEDYYEKLRIYILSYGGTNADGNKFIKKTENVNGSLFTSAIIYEKATDQYLFMMSVEDGRSVSVVQMTVNVLKSGHVQPEYVFVYENAGIAFQTKALIPVGTYTGNDDIYFDVINTTGSLSSSQMQTLSNQALKAAFSGWELLLYDYVGISLKDLGFTSYDV